MIVVRHIESGAEQRVSSLDGYGEDAWEVVGEVAEADLLAEELAALDAALLARIEAEAGAFRSRFITVSPGKELTYIRKELDARDCLAGGAGPWPMLAQEAAVRGVTVEALAATIAAMADAWQVIGGAIEAATVGAKTAVLAAGTAEEKRAAAVVDWEGLVAPPSDEGSSA